MAKYYNKFLVSPFVLDGRNCVIMVVYDITERRQAESQTMAALREKEVLLRGIHHRVKNNLQVISSMYSLQAAHITDKKTLEIFRESQNRIRSMSLIHDKLYQSKNLAEINIADYIASLISDLCISYGADNSQAKIEQEIADIALNPDTIIPYTYGVYHSIIVYTAPFSRHNGEADGTELCFPEGLNIKNIESLELQLVMTLIEQLEGRIKILKNDETCITMTMRGA